MLGGLYDTGNFSLANTNEFSIQVYWPAKSLAVPPPLIFLWNQFWSNKVFTNRHLKLNLNPKISSDKQMLIATIPHLSSTTRLKPKCEIRSKWTYFSCHFSLKLSQSQHRIEKNTIKMTLAKMFLMSLLSTYIKARSMHPLLTSKTNRKMTNYLSLSFQCLKCSYTLQADRSYWFKL